MFITPHGSARRLGAGAAFGALVASSLLLVSPASAATILVTADQIAPNDSAGFAGWHQGYDDAPTASGISSEGLTSNGKSQIINGYDDSDNQNLTADGGNAPVSSLVGASYNVVSGAAAFQALVWIDSDGPDAAAPVYATLRPEVAATGMTTIAGTDSWISNKPFGTILANTPAPLSTYISAIEGAPSLHKTVAFGVLTAGGATSTVSSISFNGDTYEFVVASPPPSKVVSTTKITRLSHAKPSARSHLKAYITVTAPGGAVAGGKVTLKYKTRTVGTGAVTANGTVRIALNYMLKKGTRTLTANFAGTSTTLASSGSLTFKVAK